jgi:hypothetical protein
MSEINMDIMKIYQARLNNTMTNANSVTAHEAPTRRPNLLVPVGSRASKIPLQETLVDDSENYLAGLLLRRK